MSYTEYASNRPNRPEPSETLGDQDFWLDGNSAGPGRLGRYGRSSGEQPGRLGRSGRSDAYSRFPPGGGWVHPHHPHLGSPVSPTAWDAKDASRDAKRGANEGRKRGALGPSTEGYASNRPYRPQPSHTRCDQDFRWDGRGADRDGKGRLGSVFGSQPGRLGRSGRLLAYSRRPPAGGVSRSGSSPSAHLIAGRVRARGLHHGIHHDGGTPRGLPTIPWLGMATQLVVSVTDRPGR